MAKQSLYEQIGGADTIEALVGEFYQRVFADPLLRPFFDGVDVEKLKSMQREFFGMALSGEVQHSSMSLRSAHRQRGIGAEHLTAFTDHLIATVHDHKLGRDAEVAIAQHIALSSEDIVGGVSEDG